MSDWLSSSPSLLLHTAITVLVVYLAIIAVTRLGGLRTLASMTSFDFAVTVSLGTVLASTIMNPTQSIVQGIMVMFILVLLQVLFSLLKRRLGWFGKVVSNRPLLLMDGQDILWRNLKAARIDENELYQKLRENNVLQFHEVKAVIMETTGTITVLHSKNPADAINPDLLRHVRRQT